MVLSKKGRPMIITSTQMTPPPLRKDVLVWEDTYKHWHVGMWDGESWTVASPTENDNFTHWADLPREPKQGVLGYAEFQHPPFDGRPCPMCPTEIRNLSAVAHNLIAQLDRGASECKIQDTLQQLREAVKSVRPLSDTHFADKYHAHGERIKKANR